jgi:hypothetical protein
MVHTTSDGRTRPTSREVFFVVDDNFTVSSAIINKPDIIVSLFLHLSDYI